MHYGAWFRRERERRGWSQAWVARRIGVTRGQMNNIEGGRSNASAETLAALCALFETTPAQMIEASERAASQEAAPAAIAHPGLDAMGANAPLRARHRIDDAELDEVRQWVTGRGVVVATARVRVSRVWPAPPTR